ncbi:MAG: hypothetical protein SGILL_008843, partial [Bacillariaceae sp.]
YGPGAAEKLLLGLEEDFGTIAPVVTMNRILQGYIDLGRMEAAEAFLELRLRQLEPIRSEIPARSFPDEATVNILLKGFVKMAKNDPKAPQIAHDRLNSLACELNIPASIQSYGIILNTWSNCVGQRDDAAHHAEALLRGPILDLYFEKPPRNSSFHEHNSNTTIQWNDKEEAMKDFTICVNIVLKCWSAQARKDFHTNKDHITSQHAVESALQLLCEFLESPSATHDSTGAKDLRQATGKPTDSTF